MNLYIINEKRLGAVYGIGTYIVELVTVLRSSGVNVFIVEINSEKLQFTSEKIDGIHYIYIPPPIQWNVEDRDQWELYHRNIVYLLKFYINDSKDLIFHLNYTKKEKLAEELKKTFSCKIILTIHLLEPSFKLMDSETFVIEKSKWQRSLDYVDHVICLSERTKKFIDECIGLDKGKTSLIKNGVADCEKISEKVSLRNKYGVSDAPIIIFAGRIDGMKGLKFVLRAFRLVLQALPKCKLIIAGNGDFNLHMQECEDIWMNVVWTGFVNKESLNDLYTIADIGVIPSFNEQCSYVVLEMMMHALPIVGTETALNDLIEDNISGLYVPIYKRDETIEIDCCLLAEKMLFLLKNRVVASSLGENAREKYLNMYSERIFRDNMLKFYDNICKKDDLKIKTLIITGQNSHQWQVSSLAIKKILENSNLFSVNILISPGQGELMSNFKPNFKEYQLVVLDYFGDKWTEETECSFIDYVCDGGGLLVYHAANNAFRQWREYNKIIGFGGWDNRSEEDGPYIYLKDNNLIYDRTAEGMGGSHGIQHEYLLHCHNQNHPITKGLPTIWRHAQDELYDRMRGSGLIKDVLYWAHSDLDMHGSGRDEMAVFTVDYKNARIFHITLGHVGNTLENNIAMQCAGFQTILLRGAEWAATDRVSQNIPVDFPTETNISLRENYKEKLFQY